MGETRRATKKRRSTTKLARIQESISHPRPNLPNFTVSGHFSVRHYVPCNFKTVTLLRRRRAAVTALRRRRRGRIFVILIGRAAVSLERAHNLAEEAFLFLGLFIRLDTGG